MSVIEAKHTAEPKTHVEKIAREGWPIIAFLVAISIFSYGFMNIWATIPFVVLALFSVYFFRNPERRVTGGENELVAPADGKIMDVTRVYEDQHLQEELIRIRIFLNIFNVHVNRMPLAGTVERAERNGRLYLAAYKDQAGSLNVRNYLVVNSKWGRILIVQITGFIARRLVCWVQPGERISRGQRFGLIRFGSCTELYINTDAEVLVAAGDRVKGGETLIARMR